jgi:hypothetical protein
MMLFDFRQETTTDAWTSINDVVMGGVSAGTLEPTGSGAAVFSGTVSLDRGGGFASVRSEPRPTDLSRYEGLLLRVRGDGKRYKVNLKHDAAFDGVLYRAEFTSSDGTWADVRLPFVSFLPSFRGRPVPDAPPLDRARVTTVGFLISDRQSGPFRLEVERIEAYGG